MSKGIKADTNEFSQWVAAFDDAVDLTYEGRDARLCLLVVGSLSKFEALHRKRYVRFKTALSPSKALSDEKWVRSIVDGYRVALVASVRTREVRGVITLPDPGEEASSEGVSPHYRYAGLHGWLGTGDFALIRSYTRDTFILGSRSLYRRHQGRLSYCGLDSLESALGDVVADSVATRVTRMCADLSFERKGALVCVLRDPTRAGEMIPDHTAEDRVNSTLRSAVSRLSTSDWPRRQLAVASAATDGALVLDRQGNVVDVGCMVGELDGAASDSTLRQSPFFVPYNSLGGSRSKAAWRASWFGPAVKVSEDGPITFFDQGCIKARV